MDAGVLTTLGGIVAMVLGLLAITAQLRKGNEALEGRLLTEMAKLRSDFKGLDDRVSDLHVEMRGLKVQVQNIEGEIQVLWAEVRGLRAEMRDLRRDVVVLQVDMGIVKHHLGIAPDGRTEIPQVQAAAGS